MKTFILLILAAGTFCSLGFRYKEGSLGYRLMQLHSDRAMSFEFSLNDYRRILLPVPVIKRILLPVPEIKRRLQSKTNALQAARELTRYKELGILNKTITCSNLLNHVIPYRTAISLLTGAAIVEASEGKMKEAVRDFERACTISRTFLKGCKTLVEIHTYHDVCCKQLTGAIRSSALPPEMKKNCLRKIPKRKAISAVLPTVLELEKRMILAAKDAKNRKETEIFFTVNEFSSAERKAFNSLSREKLSELLEKFNQQICKEFAAKTLTRNTPVLRTGSPVEDAVLQKIYGGIVRGLGKVSDTLAGRKKQ